MNYPRAIFNPISPAILFLAFGQTLVWACLYYIFPAMLLKWENALEWNKVDLTLGITLALFTSAIFSPVAGKIIDKNKGNLLLFISAVIGGSGLLLLSSITTLFQFYIIWLIIGFSIAGCLYEPCFALITKYRGHRARQDIIVITLIAGFASTICFPITHVIANMYDWRTTVAVFGLVVIFVAAPLLLIGSTIIKNHGSNPITKSETQSNAKNTSFFRNPTIYYLAICFLLLALVHGTIINHLLSILSERGYATNIAILAASCIGVMQVFGRLVLLFSDKYFSNQNFNKIVLLGMVTSVAFLLISGSSNYMLFLFIILFGSTYGMISILRPTITKKLLGYKNFGLKSGYLGGTYLIGTATAPYFGSLIWKYYGYQNLILILTILSIISWAVYLKAKQL